MTTVDRPPGSPDSPETADPAPTRRRLGIGGVLVVIASITFVVFWTWALFFASKEAINKIDDREWADRARQICESANADREALADFRRIDPADMALLRERGDLIDTSTDVVETMLDDVMAVAPTDDKGLDIVPEWESEYRTYIQNRRDYADLVRSGSNELFREAERGGIPISERLSTFAADNEMPDCSPPRDL